MTLYGIDSEVVVVSSRYVSMLVSLLTMDDIVCLLFNQQSQFCNCKKG